METRTHFRIQAALHQAKSAPEKWNALWSLGSVVTFSFLMFCLLQTLVQKITDILELFLLLFQVSEKPNNLKFQR